jgi:hypothetical protein
MSDLDEVIANTIKHLQKNKKLTKRLKTKIESCKNIKDLLRIRSKFKDIKWINKI